MKRWLERLERAGRAAEDTLLVTMLVAMLALATAQIVGRNFIGHSFILGDEALRLLVLWLTLAGAIAASRADRHVSINLLDRFFDGRALQAVKVVTHMFTASVCGLMAWFSLAFVRTTFEFGDTLLGGLPAWALQAILPLGFGLMAWQHLLHALRHARAALSRQQAH